MAQIFSSLHTCDGYAAVGFDIVTTRVSQSFGSKLRCIIGRSNFSEIFCLSAYVLEDIESVERALDQLFELYVIQRFPNHVASLLVKLDAIEILDFLERRILAGMIALIYGVVDDVFDSCITLKCYMDCYDEMLSVDWLQFCVCRILTLLFHIKLIIAIRFEM